jgi:hypothetical protein
MTPGTSILAYTSSICTYIYYILQPSSRRKRLYFSGLRTVRWTIFAHPCMPSFVCKISMVCCVVLLQPPAIHCHQAVEVIKTKINNHQPKYILPCTLNNNNSYAPNINKESTFASDLSEGSLHDQYQEPYSRSNSARAI